MRAKLSAAAAVLILLAAGVPARAAIMQATLYGTFRVLQDRQDSLHLHQPPRGALAVGGVELVYDTADAVTEPSGALTTVHGFQSANLIVYTDGSFTTEAARLA